MTAREARLYVRDRCGRLTAADWQRIFEALKEANR